MNTDQPKTTTMRETNPLRKWSKENRKPARSRKGQECPICHVIGGHDSSKHQPKPTEIQQLREQLAAALAAITEAKNIIYSVFHADKIDSRIRESCSNALRNLQSVQAGYGTAALDATIREQLSDRHKLCVDFEMKWKAECEKSRVLGNMTDGFRTQLEAALAAIERELTHHTEGTERALSLRAALAKV